MAISEKLKPLTDAIISALTATRIAHADPNGVRPGDDSLHGYMTTKDLMSALGMTGTAAEVAKMRGALKALNTAGAVYRVGLTRATRYKVVLPEDDDTDVIAASSVEGETDLGGMLLVSPDVEPGITPVIRLGDDIEPVPAVNTSPEDAQVAVAA